MDAPTLPAPTAKKANPGKLLERLSSLRAIRAPWESLWQEIADYVMPRRSPGMQGSLTPSTQRESRLFDTTAVQANMTLANGCLAWMSPQESPWFSLDPPFDKEGDSAQRWLSICTERTRQALATSTFYTSIHEFYLDRSGFGTACLYVEPGKKRLNVQCWPVGTFCIDEDEEGVVDTVFREFDLTVRQAVLKFGEAGVSAKTLKLYKQGGAKLGEKVKMLHAIYPRADEDREDGKMDAQNMPIASVYVDIDAKHVCKESGYEEMPVMVSRYLEWGTGMGALYGWSPSFAALPEARQLNFLQKMLDALAEKAAFPSILAPDELEGEIDSSAGGITYFDKTLATAAMLPKEWQTAGNYNVGVDRVKERQAAINRAFHVELFSMFSQLDKNMTAREVAERANEKLIQFSPTFSRMTVELFNPLMERLFGVLLRGGKLPPPPQEMVEARGEGIGFVPVPQIQYSSRIALSLRAAHGVASQRTLEMVGGVAKLAPETVMHFDWAGICREDAMNNGLPAKFIRPMEDVEAELQAQAAAAQQQQQQEAMGNAAEAAAKMGRVPANSPLAQRMNEAMEQQQQQS